MAASHSRPFSSNVVVTANDGLARASFQSFSLSTAAAKSRATFKLFIFAFCIPGILAASSSILELEFRLAEISPALLQGGLVIPAVCQIVNGEGKRNRIFHLVGYFGVCKEIFIV